MLCPIVAQFIMLNELTTICVCMCVMMQLQGVSCLYEVLVNCPKLQIVFYASIVNSGIA